MDYKSNRGYIINGDNIAVTKELLSNYANKIKCIYIDPPYNNGEVYNHYFDNLGHEKWLIRMEKILNQLNSFLADDGSIWISIDDKEVHYLKVLCDRIFGRVNFVTTIVWQHRTTRENRKVFSNNHEYILVYAKNISKFTQSRNLLAMTETTVSRYKNYDNDKRGVWQSVTANVQDGHAVKSQFYEIVAPNGKRHKPPKGRCWAYNEERMIQEIAQNNIWFGKDGNGVPRIKKFLDDSKKGITPETLWTASDVGTTRAAKKHILDLFPDDVVFDTPKPEGLIKRILEIATNEGELVMDVFLGSGTTVAVAHKMKRKYIGVEINPDLFSLILKRLDKVVDGENGGISKKINWSGGGKYESVDFSRINELQIFI